MPLAPIDLRLDNTFAFFPGLEGEPPVHSTGKRFLGLLSVRVALSSTGAGFFALTALEPKLEDAAIFGGAGVASKTVSSRLPSIDEVGEETVPASEAVGGSDAELLAGLQQGYGAVSEF